jgi:hypothetical protein
LRVKLKSSLIGVMASLESSSLHKTMGQTEQKKIDNPVLIHHSTCVTRVGSFFFYCSLDNENEVKLKVALNTITPLKLRYTTGLTCRPLLHVDILIKTR